MYNELFNWLMNLVNTFGDIGNWLITPLWDNWSPLLIITGGGLLVIVAIWLIKFLNPLG